MLKEVDITAFGKRVKIANAIAELRRPPCTISYGASQSFAPSTSRHSRVDDGLIYSPESAPHTGDFTGTPTGYSGSHNGMNRPSSLALTLEDRPATKTTLTDISTATSLNGGGPQDGELKDGATVTEAKFPLKGAKGTKIFGRPTGGSISSTHSLPGTALATPPPTISDVRARHQSKDSSLSASTSKSTPSTPTSPEEKAKEKSKGPVSALRGHLVDASSGPRHSFFGGSIGRSRKPAPRYS